jgi:hypothetical protein
MGLLRRAHGAQTQHCCLVLRAFTSLCGQAEPQQAQQHCEVCNQVQSLSLHRCPRARQVEPLSMPGLNAHARMHVQPQGVPCWPYWHTHRVKPRHPLLGCLQGSTGATAAQSHKAHPSAYCNATLHSNIVCLYTSAHVTQQLLAHFLKCKWIELRLQMTIVLPHIAAWAARGTGSGTGSDIYQTTNTQYTLSR